MDPQQPIDDEQRFQIELEFVQCLANPWYLNRMLGERISQNKERVDSLCGCIDLAQQQYFKDDAFIRYLEYLQYWKKPEYARFVV